MLSSYGAFLAHNISAISREPSFVTLSFFRDPRRIAKFARRLRKRTTTSVCGIAQQYGNRKARGVRLHNRQVRLGCHATQGLPAASMQIFKLKITVAWRYVWQQFIWYARSVSLPERISARQGVWWRDHANTCSLHDRVRPDLDNI